MRICLLVVSLIMVALFSTMTAYAQNVNRALTRNDGHSKGFSPKAYTGAATTVKVLALRVQFRQENPDYSGTTGDGRFDLSNPGDSITIDPAPHNKRYFQDQLEAMKNYFYDVSDGLLNIQYDVKPDGMNDAYTLNEFMYHYGITGSQQVRDIRLAKFFKDAVTLADTSDNTINFSQYDYIIVFHAGVGQDFSSRDNTPNDLSSRFVSYDLLKKFDTTSSFNGIPVDGGAVKVKSGVVVPETENQDLIDQVFQTDVFQEIGLSGILIANFGSQLGMPDLFNTSSGRPAIGMFGLEDQGAVNGNGLIPAEPDPWTKIYMGWAQPLMLSDTVSFSLYPRKLAGQNRIYKLPINGNEYFLIENRQRDVISDTINFPVRLSRIDTINVNGTQFYDTVYIAGAVRSSDTKVITKIDEYDAGIPGSGLLIWHIDERIIRDQWSTNSINNDVNNRGIRVVEASGSQDIGYAFSSGPFVTINAGDTWDFFFRGNKYFKYFNGNADTSFFSPHSTPNSYGRSQVHSGISLSNISRRQPVMTFDVRSSLLKKGFPQFTGVNFGNQSVTYGNIAGDSKQEIIITDPSGKIFAWQSGGEKVIANNLTVTHRRRGQDSTVYPLALFADLSDSLLADPALADLDNNGLMEVISLSKSGMLTAWTSADVDANGLADTLWQRNINKEFRLPPIITQDKRIIAGSTDGTIYVYDQAGQFVRHHSLNHPLLGMALAGTDTLAFRTTQNAGLFISAGGSAVLFPQSISADFAMIVTGDILQNGTKTVIEHYRSGSRHFLNSYPPTAGFPVELTDPPASPLSLADIDGDGFLEIIFGAENKIYAFNHNATLVSNFPVTIDVARSAGAVSSSVLIADLDNDLLPDLLAGASDGRIFAYDRKGKPVTGFPVSAGYTIQSSLTVADIDQNGSFSIVAPSKDGFVYAWNYTAPFSPSRALWTKIYKDAANSSQNSERNVTPSADDDWMPKKKAYCYPNPAKGHETRIRYYLSEPATVKIKLFDLAGDKVDELEGSGVALTDNEAVWNIRKIQSGVYFAKIEAKTSSGKKITRTVKIAVTK